MQSSLSAVLVLFIVRLIAIYNFIIIARVIASWIIHDPYNQIYRFLIGITEPVLGPIRSIMPNMGLDFSPIVAYLLLSILQRILTSLL
ncbi:MAG: YggT family protein [Candidatus Cloacimonadota bacterium]|jgi:YggT family protein|nr:YggT family protein [Candidatus Cloacimonadota bacterium]